MTEMNAPKLVFQTVLATLLLGGTALAQTPATPQATASPGTVGGSSRPARQVSPKTRALLKAFAKRLSKTAPKDPENAPSKAASNAPPTARVPAAPTRQPVTADLPVLDPQISAQLGRGLKLAWEGDDLVRQGEWDRAVASYLESQELFPDYFPATYGLARCAAAAGDIVSEIALYRRAIYLDRPTGYEEHLVQPPSGPARMIKTYIYGDGFRENSVPRLMEYCLLLSQTGQDEESLFIYRRAVGLLNYEDGRTALRVLLPDFGPDSPSPTRERLQAMSHVAIAIKVSDDVQKMLDLREAVRLYPDSGAAWYYLAEELRFGWKNHVEAKAAYGRARQLGDANVRALADNWLKQNPN